jgi:hypothetical protein
MACFVFGAHFQRPFPWPELRPHQPWAPRWQWFALPQENARSLTIQCNDGLDAIKYPDHNTSDPAPAKTLVFAGQGLAGNVPLLTGSTGNTCTGSSGHAVVVGADNADFIRA